MERARPKGCSKNKGAVITLCSLLACCRCASALDSSLAIDQYAHTAWTVRDGFFKGAIYAVAQTPDGYIWLGTEFGLFRFDGVRSVSWEPPPGQHLSNFIRNLLAASDGSLWIGTDDGLANWKDGKLTTYKDLAGRAVLAILEDREGTIWAGGGAPSGRLCAIRNGSTRCYGEDGDFGVGLPSLYEDSVGIFGREVRPACGDGSPGPGSTIRCQAPNTKSAR